MCTIHKLKIIPEFFEDVAKHIKNFEVRFNDRDYKVGDLLELQEYADGKYTGRFYKTRIIYILDDNTYVKDGYVILGLDLDNCIGGL